MNTISPEKIKWQPHPKQVEALRRREFEILFGGARGGAKTDGGFAWLTYPFVENNPEAAERYRALVIRKNSEDLSDWLDRAREFYLTMGGRVVGRPAEIRFPNGARFKTGHMKDDNAYTKYIGHEYQRILIEELTLIPREDDYEKLLSACRSTVPGIKPQVFCTTNPGGIGHNWVKQRWNIQGTPPYAINPVATNRGGRAFIHATVEDNPTLIEKDPDYIEWLESIKDPVLRAAWRHGDWSVFAGQYFGMFNPHVHGLQPFEIPENWELWGANDYGESHPNAFALYTKDEINSVVIRIAECVKIGNSASVNARNVRDFIDNCQLTKGRMPSKIYCPSDMWVKRRQDERAPTSPADTFKEFGLKLIRASMDRITGWRRFKELLAWESNNGKVGVGPQFRYFKGLNPRFEENIPMLIHDKHNPEDVQKCDFDHEADECRYALSGVRERRFEHTGPLRLRGV
jgi:hypothetical protein